MIIRLSFGSREFLARSRELISFLLQGISLGSGIHVWSENPLIFRFKLGQVTQSDLVWL